MVYKLEKVYQLCLILKTLFYKYSKPVYKIIIKFIYINLKKLEPLRYENYFILMVHVHVNH